jgi:hypothetical protein
MDQSIFFEGKNPKNAAKATEVLPLLVKYAEGGETVTYGELGKAVGVHHRVVRHILGVIGDALKKFDANIPMIQLIVINKKHRIVGTAGLGWLEEPEQIAARSNRTSPCRRILLHQKRRLLLPCVAHYGPKRQIPGRVPRAQAGRRLSGFVFSISFWEAPDARRA